MSIKKLSTILFVIALPSLMAQGAAETGQEQKNSLAVKCSENKIFCIASIGFAVGASYVWSEYMSPYLEDNFPGLFDLFTSDIPEREGPKKKSRPKFPNQTKFSKNQKNLEKCMRWYGLENKDVEVTWDGRTRIINKPKLRKRYHQLALKYHPDKFLGSSKEGILKFEKVAFCYEEVFRVGRD